MSGEVAEIVVRLRNARRARQDAKSVAGGVREIGTAAKGVSAAARSMGGAVRSAASESRNALSAVASRAKYGAAAVLALGVAGGKMGLSYNASLESAQLRFELFTSSAKEARKVLKGVEDVDLNSAFDLPALADTAAYLGQARGGAQGLDRELRGVANAAAAAGGGNERLQRIGIALGQIYSKGKISAEEVNQLAEAGVDVRRVLGREFGLTGDQLANLGEQGIDAREAIAAITREWTTGKMANAAKRQTQSLGGQWDLLQGNVQKVTGAMTEDLAGSLRDEVIPAANKAAGAIEEIFGRDDLSFEQKLTRSRAAIRRELGPLVDDLARMIDEADLGQHLANGVERAVPAIADAAADAAPKAAEAFIKAWLEMGPWGKLLTVAFLAGKLGAFNAAGRLAADRFGAEFKKRAGTAAGPLGSAGTTAAGTIAGDFGSAAPGAIDRQTKKGKFRRRMSGIGRGIGGIIGAGIAVEVGLALRDAALENPALSQYSGSKGWGELWRDVGDWLPGEDSEQRRARERNPGRVGAGNPAPLDPNALLGPVFPLPKIRDRMPKAITPGAHAPIQVTTQVVLDRKVIAESVDRHVGDRRARR